MSIGILLRNESEKEQGGDYVGMLQSDLTEEVVSKNLKEINSMEQLTKYHRKVDLIIRRLIKVEKLVRVVEDDTDDKKRKLHTTSLVEADSML